MRRPPSALAVLLACAALVAGAAACGGSSERTDTAPAGSLSGTVVVDGSSTVAPLTSAAAKAYTAAHPDVQVPVGITGTGGGFERFCQGQTDISDASRPITSEEAQICRDEGIGFEAFRVGFDGISVVTRAGTALGEDCLTFPELRRVWIEGSPVEDWAQIGPGFASLPLTLSGPGVDSGTYDFFNEEVLGTNAAGEANRPRTDVTTSEDDEVIVNEVLARPGVMGYFGYSYYEENRDRLRVLALNDGRGCLFPSPETIASGTYPLARPLFIYVSTESLKRPEVADFVRFYLTNGQELAEEADIVPVPRQVLDQGLNRLADLVEEASQQ